MADFSSLITPLTPGEIRQEILQEVTRRGTCPMFERAEYEIQPEIVLPPADTEPSMPLTLRELLCVDAEAFICGAYVTLLGRPPDKAGATYMAAELNAGHSRTQLLARLQCSAEARQTRKRLVGLRRHLWKQWFASLPLPGYGSRAAAVPDRGAVCSRDSTLITATKLDLTIERLDTSQAIRPLGNTMVKPPIAMSWRTVLGCTLQPSWLTVVVAQVWRPKA